mgnify:FL=1
MRAHFHRNFERRYEKLRAGEKQKLKERLNIFLQDEFDPILNNHPLQGKYQGYRSINVTGDLRTLYKKINKDTAVFVVIDTHSNLYK